MYACALIYLVRLNSLSVILSDKSESPIAKPKPEKAGDQLFENVEPLSLLDM